MGKIVGVILVFGIFWLIANAMNRYRAGEPKRQEAARKRVLEENPDAAGDELEYLTEKQWLKQSCLRCLPFIAVALGFIALYFFARFALVGIEFSQSLKIVLSIACLISVPVVLVLGGLTMISLLKTIRLTRAYQRSLEKSMEPEPPTPTRSPLEMRDALLKACKKEYGPNPLWLIFAAPWLIVGLCFGLAEVYSPESLSGNLSPQAAVILCCVIGAFFLWMAFRKIGIIRRVRRDEYVPVLAVCTAKRNEKRRSTSYSDFSVRTYISTTLTFSADSSTYTVTPYRGAEEIEVNRTYALYFFGKEGHINAICDEEQNKVICIR